MIIAGLQNRIVELLNNKRIKSVSPEAIYRALPELEKSDIDKVLEHMCETEILVKFYDLTCDEVHQVKVVEDKSLLGECVECLKCGEEFEVMDNHFLIRYKLA